MRFKLSEHASKMLAERDIKIEWVEKVVNDPDKRQEDKVFGDRYSLIGKIPEFGDRWLRLICVDQGKTIKVITAFFDRGMKRGQT